MLFLFEIKQGKGSGAAGVSYLTNDLQDAVNWAENACTAMINASDVFDLWRTESLGVESISGGNQNILKAYSCIGEGVKYMYCIAQY